MFDDVKRVMVVMGTRPEAVKLAPVISELRGSESLQVQVVSTGQHSEMLNQVNDVFGIVPDRNLNVFIPGQHINSIASRVLSGLDEVLREELPDAVVVQGDTTTVAAAALAAFNRAVPVVHLEAGLRSGDMANPFPEEGNRRMVSALATLHLAPTVSARDNLVREGHPADSIAVTGNTVIDALHTTVQQPVEFSDKAVQEAASSGRRIMLVTAHRRENLGAPLARIAWSIAEIARRYPDDVVVLPLHRNPKVREAFGRELTGLSNVILTEPQPYPEFCHLLNASHLILTDSGGVQEEAPALGKPVLVMRDTTERPEAISAGTAALVGTDPDRIVDTVALLKTSSEAYREMAHAVSPYGDGRAAPRVVAAISHMLGIGSRLPDFEVPTNAV